jgi:hypothetical protein
VVARKRGREEARVCFKSLGVSRGQFRERYHGEFFRVRTAREIVLATDCIRQAVCLASLGYRAIAS